MLRFSDSYVQLLRKFSPDTEQDYILPLQPYSRIVLGRQSSFQDVKDWPSLFKTMTTLCVKTAVKKVEKPRRISREPAGHIRYFYRPEYVDVNQAALNAEKPFWLTEIASLVNENQNTMVRYMMLNDPIHEESISRFHCVIQKETKEGEEETYSITDTGKPFSTNGIYKNNQKMKLGETMKLEEGDVLRFSPISLNGRKYIERITNGENFDGLLELQKCDVHVEFTFTKKIQDYQQSFMKAMERIDGKLRKQKRKRGEEEDMEIDSEENKKAKQDESEKKPFNTEECGICKEFIYKCAVLTCGHSFCQHCVEEWLKVHGNCPYCRIDQKPEQLKSHTETDELIEQMIQLNFTDEQKETRNQNIQVIEKEKNREEKQKHTLEIALARNKVCRCCYQIIEKGFITLYAQAKYYHLNCYVEKNKKEINEENTDLSALNEIQSHCALKVIKQ